MALTPTRLVDMAGTTIHSFASESCILYASVRQGMIRGRTRTTQTNAIARAGRAVSYGGRSWSADQHLVDYFIDPATVSTHEGYLRTLEALFPQDDDYDKAKVWFVITEDSVEKRALVSMERLQPSDSSDHPQRLGHFVGVFSLLDAKWHSASAASVEAVAKTVSPATLSVAGGDLDSDELVITLKPTAAKSAANGQRYMAQINVKWTNGWSADQLPVDITGGGWDHAAEVTATRSAADGDDVEVRWKGQRISRWVSAWDAAGTKVWCVLDFPAARSWTLRAATTDADTTWYFTEDLVNMPTLPCHAWVDSEVVLVTAFDVATRTWTVDRAERSTSGAVHAAAAKVYWLPAAQQLDLVWGYTSAATPDYIDATIKPALNLSSSTNGSFVFAEYQETRDAGSTQSRYPRALSAYTLDVVDRAEDFMYQNYVPYTETVNGTPADDNPATAMCIAYRQVGGYIGHPLQTAWGIRSPVGISNLAYTYWMDCLYYSGGADTREARLVVSAIDGDGNRSVVRTIAITSGAGPQTASHSDAIAPSAREVRFEIDPWRTLAHEPADGDGWMVNAVTLTIDSAQDVAILFGARLDAYEFGRPGAPLTLANSDSKTLKLNMVVPLNATVSIDVANRKITTPDGIGWSHLASGDWPYLPDGTNNLTMVEAGIGTVELGVSSFRKAWA